MDQKILIIDNSALLREFLKEIFEEQGFEVYIAKDGLDGLIKMRNQLPDLVILDFFLPKLNGLGFLKEKQQLKGTADIPVILLSSKINRDSIINISKYKIFKILSKPLEVDNLFKAVGELFNKNLDFDNSQCILDIHLNDDILFIEISKGLNKEKIRLVKYKILEIKNIYKIEIQKILIIFIDFEKQKNLDELLKNLMDTIFETTNINSSKISILSSIEFIKNYFKSKQKYKFTTITDDFVKSIESFGDITLDIYGEEKIDNVKKRIISSNLTMEDDVKDFKLSFSTEKIDDITDYNMGLEKKFSVAVVDDDLPILEFMEIVLSQTDWEIHVYENGKLFVDDIKNNKPDLVFLDLFMPTMSGFDVLDYLKKINSKIPVIILTAYSNKDSILKVRQFGVKSYLTKPANADLIIKKAEEILNSNFY